MTISPIGGPAPRGSKTTPTTEDLILRELRKAKKRGRTLSELKALPVFREKHQTLSSAITRMAEKGLLVRLEDVREGNLGRNQHINVLPLFVVGRATWAGRPTKSKAAVCRSCGAIQG